MMPSVTKDNSAQATPASAASNKLRPASPEEVDSWNSSTESIVSQPTDLDEAWPYAFAPGEQVWIRTAGGNWHPGRVSGMTTRSGQTREKMGLFYPVVFCDKIRKYFAPLNGEIKPDNSHVRALLEEAGWI
ncbi:hypothetical protein BD779DRAFT_1628519 [Infundibulicybe gibba]|nr:hypothetical protein BD779DRAFT_1628519 [Infundibulicybe gibba]